MGDCFAALRADGVYLRTGRLWPLVIAHFLLDAVAFVGYAALRGQVSWL